MSIKTIFLCDFCGDETENPKEADYLNVRLGHDGNLIKQVCRMCVGAIDSARGRTH